MEVEGVDMFAYKIRPGLLKYLGLEDNMGRPGDENRLTVSEETSDGIQ